MIGITVFDISLKILNFVKNIFEIFLKYSIQLSILSPNFFFRPFNFFAFTRTVHLYGGLWLFKYVLILFKKLYMFLLILIIKKDHVYHPSKELQLYFQKNTWSFLNTSYRSVSDSSFLTKLGNGIWIPLKLIVRSLSLQGVQKQGKNCQYLTIFQKFSSLLLETRKNKLNSRLYRPDNSLLLKL